jgi:hypothetical protein
MHEVREQIYKLAQAAHHVRYKLILNNTQQQQPRRRYVYKKHQLEAAARALEKRQNDSKLALVH